MLQKIKDMWSGDSKDDSADKGHEISLAVTAVMIEIMHIDGKLEEAERNEIIRAVEKRFGLSTSEVHALVEKARVEKANATDMHRFTSQIIKHYSTEERIEFLKELWQIAMADGHVDPYEEQLIRRTAELIGVYHKEFIQAKIAAREAS
ncbi:MAG: TerB family tellurite resistance protein [Mariprofundaceae bacterium]|nr:TerB family tellurite resistance protein [Mariprofundaceae bacterium]